VIDRRKILAGMSAAGALAASGARLHAQAADPDPERLPPTREMAGVGYRWAFSVSVFFRERIMIEAPFRRAFVPAVGGAIWGPRLQGRVVPYGGADFGGGGGPLDAHYMFQADDGHYIYINNRAYMRRVGLDPSTAADRHVEQPGPGQAFSQEFVAPPDSEVPLRMRTSPFFDAPKNSTHDWMNRTLFIGHGLRRVDPDRTIFTYYEIL